MSDETRLAVREEPFTLFGTTDPIASCWIATKAPNKAGYITLVIDGKNWRAHRYVWTLMRGPIPDGLELDHLCREKRCVNPQHLEAVTHRENCRRGRVGDNSRSRTNCPQGHPYDEINTIRYRGRRWCRTCVGASRRQRYQIQKALRTQ